MPEYIKAGIFPKQAEFLSYEGREALYGGAAGGGKSVCVLLGALQYVEDPSYHALILRRTFAQLSKADSILNKSKEWLMNARDSKGRKAHWSGETKTWTFPSGATIEFGHMDHADAKLNYQGGAWQYIGVDEATQFTEEMISYPRSRQRRTAGSKIPIRWRGATNPGGIGHTHIKARYVKDANGKNPSTPNRQFFAATIEDNPHIDREEYIETLREAGVDELTLAQLLKGDWDAVAGGRFLRTWFEQRYDWRGDYCRLHTPAGEIKEFKPFDCKRFITCDPAASDSKKADFTVVSTWCQSPWGDLVWLDCDRFQKDIPDIVPRIAKSVMKWRPMYVGIEAIAANNAVFKLALRHIDPIIAASPLNKGDRDKLVHATGAIVLASQKRVYLPKEGISPLFPLADVLAEVVAFTGDDKQDAHDDIVDTLSYAAETVPSLHKIGQRPNVPRVLGGPGE